jgi:hypothetical protein
MVLPASISTLPAGACVNARVTFIGRSCELERPSWRMERLPEDFGNYGRNPLGYCPKREW